MNVVYVCVSHDPEKSFDHAGAIWVTFEHT